MLNDEDHEEFAHLTEAYRDRFGIPLIVSVRDVEKRDQILKSGWERMQNAPTQEHAAAIIEVAKIANHRFDDLVADASPILGAQGRRIWRPRRRVQPPQPAGARPTDAAAPVCGGSTRMTDAEATGDPGVLPGRPPLGRRRRRAAARTTRRRAVLHQARASAASFTDDEIDAALARHPRIGEQAGAGSRRGLLRTEQAAVGDADPAVTAAIRAGNAEYESRFDRVFLIRAAGRPADRDPGRTAPPAEQHPRGGTRRGGHPAAGDRADPAGNGAGLIGRPRRTE